MWQPFMKQKTKEETKPCILDCLYLLHWQCGGHLLYPLTSQACRMLYMLKHLHLTHMTMLSRANLPE